MLDRSFSRRFVVVAAAALAVVACSAAPGDDAAQTSSAYGTGPTHCAPGYTLEIDSGEGRNGQTLRMCVPVGIVAATGAPHRTMGDSCGLPNDVPVPPVLQGLGCTPGIIIDGQPIWACPDGAAIPRTPIGQIAATQQCFDPTNGHELPTVDWVNGPCEATLVFHDLVSNCLGPAQPGWELVIDASMTTVSCGAGSSIHDPGPRSLADQPQLPGPIFVEPGSCSGGCWIGYSAPLGN